jgi:hypothetical protein
VANDFILSVNGGAEWINCTRMATGRRSAAPFHTVRNCASGALISANFIRAEMAPTVLAIKNYASGVLC